MTHNRVIMKKNQTEYDIETRRLLEKHYDRQWTPDPWLRRAKDLRRAAEILFKAYEASKTEEGVPVEIEDVDMNIPATLLLGYAVENALKAFLIKCCRWDAEKCKKSKPWRTHNLPSLFEETKLVATAEQLLLLKTLTAFILWAGKYPVAFEVSGDRGFLLPEQYDGPYICKGLPPSRLTSSSKVRVGELLEDLLRAAR